MILLCQCYSSYIVYTYIFAVGEGCYIWIALILSNSLFFLFCFLHEKNGTPVKTYHGDSKVYSFLNFLCSSASRCPQRHRAYIRQRVQDPHLHLHWWTCYHCHLDKGWSCDHSQYNPPADTDDSRYCWRHLPEHTHHCSVSDWRQSLWLIQLYGGEFQGKF